LKAILDREGIPSEIVERVAGARQFDRALKGSGRKKPSCSWATSTWWRGAREVDGRAVPLGAIQGDYLYGRGVSDDKGMTVTCLEVLLLLKRAGVAWTAM